MASLSDFLTSLANGGTGTQNSATAAVPQTPIAPNFVPEDAIAQQYSLANKLRNVAPATSWAGVAAQGLGAIGGNLVQGDANTALGNNQTLRRQDIQNASNATDLPGLEKSLIGAQTPDIQNLGLQTKIKQLSDDPNKDYRVRAAQAVQYGLQPGTPEFRSFVLAGQLPAPKDPLDQAYKTAQIEKLKKVDPVDALVANMLQPQGATAPSTPVQSPSPTAQPPILQPQSFEGTAPNNPANPLLMNVADTRSAPAGAPTPAPAPAQSAPDAGAAAPAGTDMIDTPFGKMSRADAIRKGGALTLSPKYAAAGKALLDAAQTGGPGLGLGKQGDNINDKEEIQATNQLGTLDAIVKSYDPKFLNVGNRLKYWSNEWKSKLGLLAPEDQKDLQDYAAFRQSSWHNLNRVLKDLSGTAVTENEMQRQLLDQPNPGQGIGDGDSPPTFEAKLKGEIGFAKNAVARARYLRNKGFTGKPWEAGLAVEDMPAIIQRRGTQLEQQLKQQNPQADPMQLQQAVTSQIKQEFGI